MITTEPTLGGGTPAAVSAEETKEEIRQDDYTTVVQETAGHIFDCFTEKKQLDKNVLQSVSSNDLLRAMQLAQRETINAMLETDGYRPSPLAWRPMVVAAGDRLPKPLLAFLEWVSVVRIALLEDAGGQKLKFEIRNQAAFAYQLRFRCLTENVQTVREDTPVMILQPVDGQLQLRQYNLGLSKKGFELGGVSNCVFQKDLWKSPAVRSEAALERSFAARGKKPGEIARMVKGAAHQRAKVGLKADMFPELRGAASNLESIDQIYAGLELVEALIGAVMAPRENSRLAVIAKKTKYRPEVISDMLTRFGYVHPVMTTAEESDEDKALCDDIEAQLGEHVDEYVHHLKGLELARSKQRMVTPFAFAEPALAFSQLPDTVKEEHTRKVPELDATVLLPSHKLQGRGDIGLLLRHSDLVRDFDPRSKKWTPKVVSDFGPVIKACGVLDGSTYKLLPQVFKLGGRTVVPAAALQMNRYGMPVNISQEDTKWHRPQEHGNSRSKRPRRDKMSQSGSK